MKNISIYFLLLLGLLWTAIPASAEPADSTEQIMRRDSARIAELTDQLRQMQLNEVLLRTELEDSRQQHLSADSLRLARQRQRIDSLRELTPGVPVVVEGDTLFTLYANRGGYSATVRAEMIADNLVKIGKNRKLWNDTISTLDNESYTDIMWGEKVILSLTDSDALWEGHTRQELAAEYMPILEAKIQALKKGYNLL